jgi:hypothetical protein
MHALSSCPLPRFPSPRRRPCASGSTQCAMCTHNLVVGFASRGLVPGSGDARAARPAGDKTPHTSRLPACLISDHVPSYHVHIASGNRTLSVVLDTASRPFHRAATCERDSSLVDTCQSFRPTSMGQLADGGGGAGGAGGAVGAVGGGGGAGGSKGAAEHGSMPRTQYMRILVAVGLGILLGAPAPRPARWRSSIKRLRTRADHSARHTRTHARTRAHRRTYRRSRTCARTRVHTRTRTRARARTRTTHTGTRNHTSHPPPRRRVERFFDLLQPERPTIEGLLPLGVACHRGAAVLGDLRNGVCRQAGR